MGEATAAERFGGWCFRHRGWLPIPLFVALLLPRPEPRPLAFVLLLAGESLRLWAVGHIGRKSRTRGEAVGSLMRSGPYSRLRNPLYVGNLLLWAGFATFAGGWWLLAPGILAAYYSVMVRWEERQLLGQLGAPYARYLEEVPRWWPGGRASAGPWSLGEALRSERGTFVVLAAMGASFVLRCYLPG